MKFFVRQFINSVLGKNEDVSFDDDSTNSEDIIRTFHAPNYPR